ncbi:MAG: VOC family protein [Clostridia bacterium]|nr:VOC family protein [Clostridia bacterium]
MRFSYVQIGAKDIDKLTAFYEKVCDFKKTDDKKWLNGQDGVVMEAPGFSSDSKVLFGFVKSDKGEARKINDRGYAHICFETVDMKGAISRLKKYGGSFQSTMDNPLKAPCVYCKDIEGNIVEFHIPFPSKDASIGKTLTSLLGLKKDKGIRNETGNTDLKFIHVNIITEDWRGLCDHFNTMFGSEDTGKIKDHSGSFKEGVIGVPGVHVIGKHILLPGFYLSYPTVEIFEYSIKGKDTVPQLDEIGLSAIGFKSDDLDKDKDIIIKNGGAFVKDLGEGSLLMKDKQGDLVILMK